MDRQDQGDAGKQDTSRAGAALGSKTSSLKVIRKAAYADMLRSYRILVDDKEIGSVRPNSVAEFQVQPGRLSITARIDWGRSRPLIVDAAPGQTAEIEVSNTWGALLSLWAITFGTGTYLTLKQTSAQQA